jgi:hypothetical protein
MEKHYAFIKDGRVHNVAVFAAENQELADRIVQEQGYDLAVWVGEDKPITHSTYDGVSFASPTEEYLISIGDIIVQKETEVTQE